MSTLPRAVCVLMLPALLAAPVRAQERFDASESDFALLSIHAVVGGASAAVVALLRGEDVTDAMALGALGGGLSFAGKRIATSDFTASGFVGRQVAALGHNVVVNAGRGAPAFAELWFPIGPLQLRVPSWQRGGRAGWDARLDLVSTGGILWAATVPELELDWSSTLEQGTPVFFAPRHRIAYDGIPYGGVAPPGLILLSGDVGRDPGGTLGHEMVHVIQHDFMAMAWSYPLEQWLRERLAPGQDWLARFPVGGVAPALATLLYWTTGEDSFVQDWMEHEAWSLTSGQRRLRRVWAP